jgi:hypothetical protein
VPEIDDEDKEKEYLAILAIFERFLDERDGMEEPWEVMEELMALRADFAIHHAIHGFGMEWDDAIELVQSNLESLSEEDRARADILIAAINNMVEFAVVEEYQMMSEADDVDEEAEEGDLSDEEREELLLAVCKKYNSQYAYVENLDIEYAMMVADALVVIAADTELMYMTQGDERVRPWHLQYEGFTAPKSRFPAWLIPPIEHRCRCYLVEVDNTGAKLNNVQNNTLKMPEMPEWFNRTFKESVALGGRIFSDEHPYFQVNSNDSSRLAEIVQRIKEKYLNG